VQIRLVRVREKHTCRFGPADLGIHYSGVPVLAPYQDYPADRFPDTLIVRRSIGQKVLQRLLTQHSTSSKLVRIAGTVRGVRASKNKTSIDSVTVRQLDGSHLSLDNVALVIGQSLHTVQLVSI
jgi:hypothetical protein